MNKLALTLVAYLACFQSAHAATTALAESLREYEAITDFIGAPGFTKIGPSEFIVGINRITRHIDVLGIVKYDICTRKVVEVLDNEARRNNYIATLFVAPNPGIGPNIVTVISIEKCDREDEIRP